MKELNAVAEQGQRIRVLRILEYVGDPDCIRRDLEKRGVKETRYGRGYTIREAFVGGILGLADYIPDPEVTRMHNLDNED